METGILTRSDTHCVRSFDEVEAEAFRQLSAQLPPDPHLVENREFFAGKSLAELATEQGVGPIKDIKVFAGGFPEDEDLDELLAELHRLRAS